MFSPRVWLLVGLVLGVLAAGSGILLTSRGDDGVNSLLVRAYDSTELFVRDTIRLSFKDRKVRGVQDAVFVAPKGILDKKMMFTWIDDVKDMEQKPEEAAPEPLAPVRILDPQWRPDFSGLPPDKELR